MDIFDYFVSRSLVVSNCELPGSVISGCRITYLSPISSPYFERLIGRAICIMNRSSSMIVFPFFTVSAYKYKGSLLSIEGGLGMGDTMAMMRLKEYMRRIEKIPPPRVIVSSNPSPSTYVQRNTGPPRIP